MAEMGPFVKTMTLEGFYEMKPACYDSDEINPTKPTCLKGAPWIEQQAASLLAGPFTNKNNKMIVNDNFHRASTVYPYHHPALDGACPSNTGKAGCSFTHVTCTENVYELLNELDLGITPIAASEMKAKLKSAQILHEEAGEADASYDALDMQWDECQRINQASFDMALDLASSEARTRYN